VTDFIHNLDDPAGWVAGVLSNFVAHGFDPETSVVRWGQTGLGMFPNYRIEKPSRPSTINVLGTILHGVATPASTFNGRNHREMTELDEMEWHSENWSTETMTFAELKRLRSRNGKIEDTPPRPQVAGKRGPYRKRSIYVS
jgi:hypothetical protein